MKKIKSVLGPPKRLSSRYINIATTQYNELAGATAQSSLKKSQRNKNEKEKRK
jgi:hypothetical protein